jgi:hypothetical protein
MSIRCDSRDYWWPHIKLLAKSFEENLNKRGKETSVRIKLDDKKLDLALNRYVHKWAHFKSKIYGDNVDDKRIDRHKIIALYIECFLKESPFRIEGYSKNEKIDLHFMLANEFFSLSFMEVVINSWHGKAEPFKMEKKEKKWFVILLNHYSSNPSTLDILSLAQIIYYIEKPYAANKD